MDVLWGDNPLQKKNSLKDDEYAFSASFSPYSSASFQYPGQDPSQLLSPHASSSSSISPSTAFSSSLHYNLQTLLAALYSKGLKHIHGHPIISLIDPVLLEQQHLEYKQSAFYTGPKSFIDFACESLPWYSTPFAEDSKWLGLTTLSRFLDRWGGDKPYHVAGKVLNTLHWRKQYRVSDLAISKQVLLKLAATQDLVEKKALIPPSSFARLAGLDPQGRPVLVLKFKENSNIRELVTLLEVAESILESPLSKSNQWVWIIHWKSDSNTNADTSTTINEEKSDNKSSSNLIDAFKICNSHYVGRLHKAYVIGAPFYVTRLFNFFAHRDTKALVHFISQADAKKVMGPVYYDFSVTFSLNQDLHTTSLPDNNNSINNNKNNNLFHRNKQDSLNNNSNNNLGVYEQAYIEASTTLHRPQPYRGASSNLDSTNSLSSFSAFYLAFLSIFSSLPSLFSKKFCDGLASQVWSSCCTVASRIFYFFSFFLAIGPFLRKSVKVSGFILALLLLSLVYCLLIIFTSNLHQCRAEQAVAPIWQKFLLITQLPSLRLF